ncbi:uncharacterized protein LOC121591648 isoform X2 [Anopheles merus]|nr:uncharacterized protein LOC121591648 isoform X2 [Anopheles merus]
MFKDLLLIFCLATIALAGDYEDYESMEHTDHSKYEYEYGPKDFPTSGYKIHWEELEDNSVKQPNTLNETVISAGVVE